jgi:alanine racemase
MSTPTLTVHEHAIAANTRAIAGSTPGSVMAVLKANAFGHGIRSDLVLEHGAASLGVTSIDEALALRSRGVRAPILSWLNPVDADHEAALRAGVQLAVPSAAHLEAIARAALAAGRPARVHLHIDVGMARDGAARDEWRPLCDIARVAERRGLLDVVGVMGHLSSADSPADPANAVETLVFGNAVRTAVRAGLTPRVRHLAATVATLTAPGTHFDLSRIGAGLYGIDPSGRTPLRGAMTLAAPVVGVRRVRPGTGVGYGATVFGPGAAGEPTVHDWARWSGTIAHDIVTGIGARVARTVEPLSEDAA